MMAFTINKSFVLAAINVGIISLFILENTINTNIYISIMSPAPTSTKMSVFWGLAVDFFLK